MEPKEPTYPQQDDDRLAALEARVRLLEDQLAVQQLLNRWGPAVDTGESAAAAGPVRFSRALPWD